jgi:hypothetical protein
MTDYKPTLAWLFPELFAENLPTIITSFNRDFDVSFYDNKRFQYWGYVDMDLVWGNFSRFAHLFQGDYAVITSGNERRWQQLMLQFTLWVV